MDRLNEIIERVNKTSKGEWHYNNSSCVLTMGNLSDVEMGNGKYRIVAPFIQFSMTQIDNDFNFLANSKGDVEYLVDEVKRLRKIDSMNLKPKEEILNQINRYNGEIQTLRTKMMDEHNNSIYQRLYGQERELRAKIEVLYWVLGNT